MHYITQYFSRTPRWSWVSVIDILLVAARFITSCALCVGRVRLRCCWAWRPWPSPSTLPTSQSLENPRLAYRNDAALQHLRAHRDFRANEIRHALAKLGRNFMWSPAAQSSASDAFDDIVLAANLFSQNQTGALIVIEREIGLRTYIESGVSLDAHLSSDLLATIFTRALRCMTEP